MHTAFETSTSTVYYSNDARLDVLPERNTGGWVVVDTTDSHVQMFTMKREIADAFVAGYDYAQVAEVAS